ncbi:MAG TPA: hypothetical protein PKC49_04265 [Phycisphaerae bacterium]|nr:hypothetical protein [Phycisphaerae bacterium]
MTPEQEQRRRLLIRSMKINRALTPHVGLWETYVRDFIRRYQLDQDQCEKAGAILLECQKRAQEIVARRRNDLAEIVSKLLDASEAGKAEEAARFRRQLQDGLRPIEAIFEQSLKPRLEKLPTREQRKRAEEAEQRPPASQPAAHPSPRRPSRRRLDGSRAGSSAGVSARRRRAVSPSAPCAATAPGRAGPRTAVR